MVLIFRFAFAVCQASDTSRSKNHQSFDRFRCEYLIRSRGSQSFREKQIYSFCAMSMALNRFTQWLWAGGAGRVATHELPSAALTNASFPDFPSGFREPDTVTFYTAGAGGRRTRPRRVRNRRRSRGEARVDREYDMVIVPSDGGGCLSGSESDDSDWSIGWLEPQAPELQTDGDPENSFAVLVPCYRRGRSEQTGRAEGRFLGAGTLADGSLSDGNNFVEQWLSSIQN